MSTRAYRIEVPAVLAKEATFNITHDETILSFFQEHEDTGREDSLFSFSDYRDEDSGSGTFEVGIGLIEKLIESGEVSDIDILASLASDIRFAKGRQQNYVIYECF